MSGGPRPWIGAPQICPACNNSAPQLIVEPDTLLQNAFLWALLVITLACIHFFIRMVQDMLQKKWWPYDFLFVAPSVPDVEPGAKKKAGLQEVGNAQKRDDAMLATMKSWFLPVHDGKPLDLFMVAKLGDEGFTNFLVLCALETLLNFTATVNTTLEGDYEFANDPYHVTLRLAWVLTITNAVLLVLFWVRRAPSSSPHRPR